MISKKGMADVIRALNQAGVDVDGTETRKGGTPVLYIRRGTVQAKMFAAGRNLTHRTIQNMISMAKGLLRNKGASFDAEPIAPDPRQQRQKLKLMMTRLNRQEKADFYAMCVSKMDFIEVCDTYQVHVSTGKRILDEGKAGGFDDLLPDEYKARKEPAPQAQAVAFIKGALPPEPADIPSPGAPKLEISEPSPGLASEAAPEPKEKLSPLDPRLLVLAAEVKLIQERHAELVKKGAELGIEITCTVEAKWHEHD